MRSDRDPMHVYVELPCNECLVEVVGWASETDSEAHPSWRTVSINLFSSHAGEYRRSWRGRIRLALQALRGEYCNWLEVLDQDALDRLIAALQDARRQVWGEN